MTAKLARIFLATLIAVLILQPYKAGAVGACTCARFNDFKDHGCHKTSGGVGAPPSWAQNPGGNKANCPTCPGPIGTPLAGPDAADASTSALGMPRWWVDEPYVNLHVVDEPLSYTTSSGQKMAFQCFYKQRYDLPNYDQIPNLFYALNYDRIENNNDPFDSVYAMRSYGGTNNVKSGMTNAAWSHNWMMNIVVWDAAWESYYNTIKSISPFAQPSYPPFSNNYEALAFSPDSGVDYYTYNAGNGALNASTQLTEPVSHVQLTSFPHSYPDLTNTATPDANGIYWGSTTNGLKLLYPDGSQDIFSLGLGFGSSPGLIYIDTTTSALLTERIDAQGRITKLGYESIQFTNGCNVSDHYLGFRLKYVVDSDGRTNTFVYTASGFNAWQLQEIDDPFGRKATFGYQSCNDWLSSITDANGMSNSFSYQSGTSGWLSSLTTPYGTTGFSYYQVPDTNGAITNGFEQRATLISEPDSAKQLFYYKHNASGIIESNATAPSISGQVFDDGTSGALDPELYHRNSFHWDRRQFANLAGSVTSASLVGNLTAADYQKGAMQHWLLDTDKISITETASSERDPSPDAAGTVKGSRTWHAYGGTPSTNADILATPQIGCVAQFLPDGSTQYATYGYYSTGLASSDVQTFTQPNGTIGQFTTSFSYGANGVDLTQITNSLGQFVNLGYNGNHELLAMTNALNQVSTFGYDSTTYNITSVALSTGQSVALAYSGGFLNQITLLPQGRTNTFVSYSGPNPQVIHVTAMGMPELWLTNSWDALNRLTGVVYQDNTTVSNIYTLLDLTTHKDRLGNLTQYAYDGLQHLTSMTDARSNITQFTWCDCGALTSISNALQNITYLNYNNQELLTNVSFPDGSGLTWQYDLLGRVTNRFDGAGNSFQYTYNNQSSVTAVANVYGQVWGCYRDALGRIVTATNVNNVVTTNLFDILNRITNRAWAGGGTENFGWATNGLIAYTNQDGQWVHFGRDGASRLTALTNAVQTESFGWNGLDKLTSLTDGLNHTTTWAYNQYGWLTNKANTLGTNIIKYSCDADGRVTNRWMMGTNTAYTYDAVGNLKTIIYPALTITNFYDAINELTNMLDGIGSTAFTYTQTGQLATESGPWASNTISFGYNQGHRTSLSLQQPSGSVWSQTYSYDGEWRMTGVSSAAGAFTYGYAGNTSPLIQSIALPNAASIVNNYDTLGRLTGTALTDYWGHVLDGSAYGMDALGLRTNLTRELGLTTNTVSIGYDGIGQLTSWSGREPGGALRHNEQQDYGYDSAGNLFARTNDQFQQYTVLDSLNQLSEDVWTGHFTEVGSLSVPVTNMTVNGAAAQVYADLTFAATNIALNINSYSSYTNNFTNVAHNAYGVTVSNVLTARLAPSVDFYYDDNGNLTNDDTRVFSYDAENQLTNVFATNAWRVGFVYDGLNRRRIERDYQWSGVAWVLTNEAHFIYDGLQLLQERDVNNNPAVTYTRGLDLSLSRTGTGGIGGMLARTDTNGSTYYHADGSGNVTALMDGYQRIVARYEYGPFGRLIGQWGTMATANRMGFSSMPKLGMSGLVGYPFREYDPIVPRFTSRDPIGERGGINLYGFVGNNPLRFVDPYGLWEQGMTDFTTPQQADDSVQSMQAGAQMAEDALLGIPSFLDWAGDQSRLTDLLGMPPSDILQALGPVLPDLVPPELPEVAAGEDAAAAAKLKVKCPEKAKAVASRALRKKSPAPGYKGGRIFANDGRGGGQTLPQIDPAGDPITYREWDVNPYQPGVDRGAERVVTGSDGSAYYTDDHYSTFNKIQ